MLNDGPENTIPYHPGTYYYIQIAYGGAGIVCPGTTPTPGATHVCFAVGTRIATPNDLRRNEDLVAGDLVRVWDGHDLPMRWIRLRESGAKALAENPTLRLIRILPGAPGQYMPERALRGSRQHRICVSG